MEFLNNKIFVDIITESVLSLLTERLSSVLWHFCDFEAISAILRTNSFKLSQSNVDREELPGVTGYSDKRNYYMCFTRSRNSKEGYSRIFSDSDNHEGYARITINGDALNNIAHGKASDYFGSRDDEYIDGKRALYKNIEKGKYKSIEQAYKQNYGPVQDNEKEDTLWYDKPEIKNANRYIVRVDIFISTEKSFKENWDIFVSQQSWGQRIGVPVYFYTNLKDFDAQNDRCINPQYFAKKNSEQNKPESYNDI